MSKTPDEVLKGWDNFVIKSAEHAYYQREGELIYIDGCSGLASALREAIKQRDEALAKLQWAKDALRNIAGVIEYPADVLPERFLAREALAKIEDEK